AGSDSLQAADTTNAALTVSAATVVSPAATDHFTVSAPATATAGVAVTVTVTAQDRFGNTTGSGPNAYTGTVQFGSSDGTAALPANSTLAGGVGTFSVTFNQAGTQTVTATDSADSALTGVSAAVAVNPASATHFAIGTPAGATAGGAFNFTVTALDAHNNTVSGYSGTVAFSSTDTAATLPAAATLINGQGTFTATLKTAGNQTITATDQANASVTGASAAVSVSAAAVSQFAVSAPSPEPAGTAFSFTVRALDAFNNVAAAYAGTVHFSSTDGSAVLPANATLTSGQGTFSATFKKAGDQQLTAT